MKAKGIVFLILITLGSCAPLKSEVSDADFRKLLDRFAYIRFSSRLEVEDLSKIKSDKQIFLEICEIYRLDPDKVISKLKSNNNPLGERLKPTHEK